MERIYKALRDFILEDVNAALPKWEDGEAEMPPLNGRTIAFGAIDPLRTAGETLCAILPESLEPQDGYIAGEGRAQATVTCAFWCRGAQYGELMARMSRYAACFLKCLEANPSLGGRARDCGASRVDYDWDCGVADRQAAACMIQLSVRMEED